MGRVKNLSNIFVALVLLFSSMLAPSLASAEGINNTQIEKKIKINTANENQAIINAEMRLFVGDNGAYSQYYSSNNEMIFRHIENYIGNLASEAPIDLYLLVDYMENDVRITYLDELVVTKEEFYALSELSIAESVNKTAFENDLDFKTNYKFDIYDELNDNRTRQLFSLYGDSYILAKPAAKNVNLRYFYADYDQNVSAAESGESYKNVFLQNVISFTNSNKLSEQYSEAFDLEFEGNVEIESIGLQNFNFSNVHSKSRVSNGSYVISYQSKSDFSKWKGTLHVHSNTVKALAENANALNITSKNTQLNDEVVYLDFNTKEVNGEFEKKYSSSPERYKLIVEHGGNIIKEVEIEGVDSFYQSIELGTAPPGKYEYYIIKKFNDNSIIESNKLSFYYKWKPLIVDKASVESQITAPSVVVEAPTLTANAAKVEVIIEKDVIELLVKNNKDITVQVGEVEVIVPLAVLKQAGDKTVVFTIGLSDQIAPSTPLNVVSETFTFTMTAGDSVISAFDQAIDVKVPVNLKQVKDVNKLAAYYVNYATNQYEFVGGKYEDGYIVFKTMHFSDYVVLEGNMTFSDIDNHWAQKEIEQLASKSIINGKTATEFDPNATITRSEFAALISRALNLEKQPVQGTFTDVESSSLWFAQDVEAAARAGIINGVGDGSFQPTESITREQMATMIVRAIEYVYSSTVSNDVKGIVFADANTIGSYAVTSVNVASLLGVINGVEENGVTYFKPLNKATRAEAAKMLVNMLSNL